MNPAPQDNQGFIVLTSVIILSIVLLMIAQTMSSSGYFQRQGTVEFESKQFSYVLAQSCLDHALYNLSNDLDYAGNETFTVSGFTCTVDPITTQGDNTTIQISSTVRTSTTKLKMVVDLYLDVVSYREQ